MPAPAEGEGEEAQRRGRRQGQAQEDLDGDPGKEEENEHNPVFSFLKEIALAPDIVTLLEIDGLTPRNYQSPQKLVSQETRAFFE